MRHVFMFSFVTFLAVALVVGELSARPGGGGGGGRGGPAGGAGGGRGAGGPSGGPAAGRSNGPAASGNRSPGRDAGPGTRGEGLNQGAVGKQGGKLDGKVDGKFEGDRPSKDQVQDFLGQKPNGEGQRGEGERGENREQNKAQAQAQASQVKSNLQGRADDLFTPQWYLDHPNAWQATHPHADAWAVATAGAVARWVGYAAVAGTGGTTTVIEEDSTEPTQETSAQTPQDLATSAPAEENGEWLPLGVFALVQNAQADPNTMLQLSVNKQGAIGGSYYDLIGDAGSPVQGAVDKGTQRVAWTVGKNKGTVFATNVDTLTSDAGSVTLHLPNGKTQQWKLVRLQPNGQGEKGAAKAAK